MPIALRLALAVSIGLALAPLQAQACSRPQSIVRPVPQAPVEGFEVLKLRIVNGLMAGSEVLALEGVVIEGNDRFRAGTLVRFLVPDRWMDGASCHVGPYRDTLNADGEAVGYFQLGASDLPGFLAVRFPVSRNAARLRLLSKDAEWRSIRFADGT